MRVRFLALLLVLSAAGAAQASSFQSKMVQARDTLMALCAVNRNSPVCPGGDFRLQGHEKLGDDFGLEEQLMSELYSSAKSVFPFKERVQSQGVNAITPAEVRNYYQTMQWMDRISRSRNVFEVRIIEIMALLLVTEWLDTYGDPLREANVLVDEGEAELPGREDLRKAESKVSHTYLAYAAGSLGALLITAAGNKITRNIANNSRFVLLGLRSRLNLDVLGAAAFGIGAAYHARFAEQADGRRRGILQSPAHLIRFRMTNDVATADLDFSAAWGEKEFQIYESAAGALAFIGAEIVVARYIEASGARVNRSFWTRAGRLGKVARFFRITPAGIVIGLGAESIVGNLLDIARMESFDSRFISSAENNDVYSALLVISQRSFMHSQSLLLPKHTIEFYQALRGAAIAIDSRNAEEYRKHRYLLSQLTDETNFPEETGAKKLSNWICNLMAAPVSTRNKAKPLTGNNGPASQASQRIIRESLILERQMKRRLGGAASSQRRHLTWLQGLQRARPAIFAIRRANAPNWLAERPAIRTLLAAQVHKTNDNIQRFERASNVANMSEPRLFQRLLDWTEKVFVQERQEGFQSTATFFNCR